MASATVRLDYIDPVTKEESSDVHLCDYFKDFKTLVTINQKLLLEGNEQAGIAVYIRSLNFEHSLKNTKTFMTINEKKYKVLSVEPYSGFGQSVTILSGVETK